jgi:hypothetical protein
MYFVDAVNSYSTQKLPSPLCDHVKYRKNIKHISKEKNESHVVIR